MTGAASALDDAEIPDDAVLLRRVAPAQMDRDGNRVTSNAFNDITDRDTGARAVSVFVQAEIEKLGVSLADMVAEHEGFGVVAITAGEVRALGLGVTWEPNDRAYGPAHAHINGGKPKGVRRALATASRQVLWPGV